MHVELFCNKISIFIEVSAIQLSNISIHGKDIYIRYTFSSNFDVFINCCELFYTVERRDLSILYNYLYNSKKRRVNVK